ncbi:Hypothetical protein CINCED_3A010877 [Cinara cedri]|uniref:Uncharacterized protein n=1 Tax=Cinara cedri TaxID=506608 RepID=A0A5E4MUH3_9HEMI|nr:Hypothetical protein CINCED_3A010877 [Cinara cedri]
MWPKTVTVATCLWLLTSNDFRLSSASKDATYEDIRTAIYSFAHSLRDNVDKLERHERREIQSGDKMQNMLLTIVNKQIQQKADYQALETAIKDLGHNVDVLTNAEKDEVTSTISVKSMLNNIDNRIVNGEAELMSILITQQKSADESRQLLDTKLAAMSEQIIALQSRFEAIEQAPKAKVSNDVIFELMQKISADQQSFLIASQTSGPSNDTSQMVQEAKHAVVETINVLSTKLDDDKRRREAFETKLIGAVESTKAFQDDVQNSFQLMSEEVRTLSDVQKTLAQTSDNVMDAKRRIEYSTHQILTEVTSVVNERSKELNDSVNAGIERAMKAVLDAQTTGMANVSLKIEMEISQVWRQIGIMYQTLTDSASTLATLQKQTDTFVNSTATSVDGMNNKVSAIAGRMSEVDDNLNYLLGRLSLVTQEFKEIKVGLGEALENIRIGLETVQGSKKAVDLGPGPNPIDEEPLSENINPHILSKTVYTVS